MSIHSLVQLPDDARAAGYRQTRPYHYEQLFSSAKAGMTGTEAEFVAAGHGYRYVQIDQHTRLQVTP